MSELAERLMALTAGKAVQLDAPPGGGEPEWTPQDAAHACQGLDMRRYAAFAYRWARDQSLYSTLYGYLFSATAELAESERWPFRTRSGQRYLDRLVRLAIFEEWNSTATLISRLSSAERQSLFGKLPDAIRDLPQGGLNRELRPYLLATLAEVSLTDWRVELARRYEGIRQILESWCTDAHHHVMSRIATPDSSSRGTQERRRPAR